MGSTRIDAPQIDPINVAQQIKDTSRAYRESTPDIIAAERALRGPMQQLALQDAQTALMGGVTPGMLRDRDAAEQQLQTAQQQRSSQEGDIQSRIDELSSKTGYDDESEISRLNNLKDEYADLVANDDENKEAYQNTLDTINAEIAFTPEQREERFSGQQRQRNSQEAEKLASELQGLKESGDLSDDAIATLESNFNAAADSVLDANPGMLELSRRAVESQAEVGRKLKDAAAKGEFATISELAPDLVKLYRESDPGSQNLADLASQRAEQVSTQSPSDAQASFKNLAQQISGRTPGDRALGVDEVAGPGDRLGTTARAGAQELMGGEAMGQTADQQTVAGQIQNLLSGPQAGAAEQRLLQAAGQGPSVAEQRLLQAAGRPASQEAQALGQFGQQALQAGPRGASDVEQALQQQALQQLGFQAGGPSQEEQALQQRIGGLIGSAGMLSPAQQRQAEQEALAMGQRQGRIRDTSTAAGVAGRLSEARRADEASDLMAAQQLLGQQQSMQQARSAEEMQRMGMGGQMAGSTEAMQQQRLSEQRASQQMGMGATGTAAGLQAQQAGLQQQALQAAGGMAGQRVGQAQQALTGAGSLEQARMGQQLQGTGLAQNIAQAGFASEMAGREQQLREFGVGAQEAARFAQQQAQQDAALAGLYGQQAGMEQQQFGQQQALAGQDDRRLQQAFGMQKAMGPDIGAFFGRPASQAAGLQVAGMAQQQAQYGTTPQATDPMLGVNMALQQQANQAGLDASAMSANAQQQAGMFGGIAQLGSAAMFACWVAREVYGQNNPMWLLFRGWLFDEAPSWFRKIYIKHGERFAEFISNKPFIKSFIRKWMTSIVKKHYK